MVIGVSAWYPDKCIPVGCVLATHRPYAGVSFPGGVCLVQGVWSRGWDVCLIWGGLVQGGVCLVRGGLVPGGWDVCLVQGVWSRGVSGPGGSGPGGSAWWGGLPGPGGVCLVPAGSGIPACTEADTLPPCGQTDTCKNITLATTSLRPVTMRDFVSSSTD